MKKLTSIIKEECQLRLIGFSTWPPTVVLKGDKPHASTSAQSTDKLDNLSYVGISKWK